MKAASGLRVVDVFKNLGTSAKLLILCGAFVISLAVPVYGLVSEELIAIEFARKELSGSRYLANVREVYSAIFAFGLRDTVADTSDAVKDSILKKLSDEESRTRGEFETAIFARALERSLEALWSRTASDAHVNALLVDSLFRAQALAARVGDDSNLALDPDLDTYYIQNVIARKLPRLLGELADLQEYFESSNAAGMPSIVREARLQTLASLVRSTAAEVTDYLASAYRGNIDGRLQRTVGGSFTDMSIDLDSYLGALSVSTTGVDVRDTVESKRFHVKILQGALKSWSVAEFELDRLLQQRVANLLVKMWLGLVIIGALGGLSIVIAILTHRHIVRPLERLETVASAVRETKDYSLRVEYGSQDEIGRVTEAFNDMLSELDAARRRETAERAELARVTRLTTMGEMAASIAHEVNQPLAGIVANGHAGLRWLAKTPPDTDKIHAALQRVVRDGLRASEVVGSVRGMFKRDAQRKTRVRLAELIDEVLAHLQSELQSANIAVQIELGEDVRSVPADRVQLQQVFLNLIGNAIDAMRAMQDWPRLLRIRARLSEGDSVSIDVEDSGVGISAEDKARVFDPFFTTKSSGMGLGLSICRSIIESHGGRLWVSAGNSRGTVFEFTLPSGETGDR
jgi:signal transduction histidine kinase